ncbi:MAG: CopL family metal-binding regulatory protein [Nevskia sp.]|uniref:CopL family metal-binding regulatory protein n=1 Tax=Nevskia sp. TaxID=1929292 RepID=UPI0040356A98
MKTRRLALSLLTVLALLWQGVASAAMGAAMVQPAPVAVEAAAEMPCHDMAGMDHMAPAADHAAADHQNPHDCCGNGGHCLCAAACGAAALPMPGFALSLVPSPDLTARAILAVLRDRAPPHPFRPPIAAAV